MLESLAAWLRRLTTPTDDVPDDRPHCWKPIGDDLPCFRSRDAETLGTSTPRQPSAPERTENLNA